MSSPKVLPTSALAHSASILQTKHEKSIGGIKDIKHWSALDAALQSLHRQPAGVDFFEVHHSPHHLLHLISTEPLSLLDFDDNSSNGDVDYFIEDFEIHEQPPPRLHGTPLAVSVPTSLPKLTKVFVDLSATSDTEKTTKPRKVARTKKAPQPDEAKGAPCPLVLFPNGNNRSSSNEFLSPAIRKGPLHFPKQPAIVHRGLPLTKTSPELSPMSFKLLCANEMPSPVVRIPLSGSPLQHPFRVAHKKSAPIGNVEGAVQIFKVETSRRFPILGALGHSGMHLSREQNPVPPTPAPPLSQPQFEIPELPPLGEAKSPQYWGQVKPMEAASQLITQPPRDYGFVIHLALNRQK